MKLRKLKAVIFDMDGTFVQTESFHKRLLERRLKKEFGKPYPMKIRRQLMGQNERATWTKLKQIYNLSPTVEELMEVHYQATYHIMEKKKLHSWRGFTNLLNALQQKSIPMAVASSSRRTIIELIVKKLGIEQFFTAIVGGDEVSRSKPHPDIFLQAANVLNVPPTKCLVIEDSHNGVVGAKRAKCFCAGFKPHHFSFFSDEAQDLSSADFLLKDYSKKSIFDIIKLF